MGIRRHALACLILSISLYGCSGSGTSGSGSSGSGGALTLNVDQMSPVPLVNGNPQSFYMYATNYGTAQLSNLTWSANLQGSTSEATKGNILSKAKAKLSNFIQHSNIKPKDTTNPITIVNANECTTIAAGGTCRIELQTTAPGTIVLDVASGNQKINLGGGGGLIQTDNYPTNSTGDSADALSLSPISTFSYAGGGGSNNFYIINNGVLPVELTAASIAKDIPANATLDFAICPNPLPGGQACQMRLALTNPTGSTTQELSIPLTLSGDVINSDDTRTALPMQNADVTLTATTAMLGIIQPISSQSLIVDASSGVAAPVAGAGVVSNTGAGPLTITSVSSASELITLSNDNCSGKTLGQGEMCSYTPNLNVDSITSSGSELVNISYNTGSGTALQTTTGAISWTYIAPNPTPGQPSVIPNLTMSANALFNQNISKGIDTSSTYVVTLINNSTAYSGADATLTIPYASLLPANDSAASYAINVTGITDSPCTLPSSGNTMTLAIKARCVYHIVLTTGSEASVSTSKVLNTNYSYNTYTGGTASLTPASTLENAYNLQVTSPLAQLSVGIVSGQGNNFNGIEQGLTSPTLGLTIINIGSGAVSGNLSASLPSGISGSFANCTNLAANESCIATLTMSTTDAIAAANLNTVDLSYNNGATATTADLPSIIYSVVAPDMPNITMLESVTGCVSGNGTSSPCMNNPDNKGGSASNMQVVLTFANSASVAATSVSLASSSESAFTAQGYTQGSNTCGSGAGANGGTCTITYAMPATASTTAIQPNLSQASFGFNYAYGSQGQLSGSNTTNLSVLISVVNPQLSITAIESVPQGESKPISLMWSNLYQSSVPTTNVIATASDGISQVVGLTPYPAAAAICGTLSGSGAICTSSITTTESTPLAVDYKFTASSTITPPTVATFIVSASPLMTFFAGNNGAGWNGNMLGQAQAAPVNATGITTGVQGADAICMYEAGKANWHSNIPSGKTWKAMIVDGVNRSACAGSNCYQNPTGAIDWVLQPNMLYINEARQPIGITTATALFNFDTTNAIAFKLEAVFSNLYVFSFQGMNTEWGTAPNANCLQWTSSSINDSVILGAQERGNIILSNIQLRGGTYKCDQAVQVNGARGLTCIQQ